MANRKWLGFIALAVALIVVLGVGLGIGLASSSEDASPAGGTTDAADNTDPVAQAADGATANMEQIEEIIGQFEGVAGVGLEPMPELERPDCTYVTDGETIYGVDVQSGTVEWIFYGGNLAGREKVLITKEEAQAIATEFAQQHCEFFAILTLTTSELVDYYAPFRDAGLPFPVSTTCEYRFEWTQIVDGATTPNRACVEVNPGTGQIMSYHCKYQPLESSGSPTVTKEEAVAIVKDRVMERVKDYSSFFAGLPETWGEPQVQEVLIKDGPELKIIVEDGKQYLTWYIQASAVITGAAPCIGGGYWIDAGTGEVVRYWSYL